MVDSRACLTNNAPHRHGGRTLAPLRKWPFPAHPVIAVAAGGAWSGESPTLLIPLESLVHALVIGVHAIEGPKVVTSPRELDFGGCYSANEGPILISLH